MLESNQGERTLSYLYCKANLNKSIFKIPCNTDPLLHCYLEHIVLICILPVSVY